MQTTTACSLSPARRAERASGSRREAAAVILTGAAHLFFEGVLDAKWPFMLVAVTAWSFYLLRRVRQDKTVLRQWGFRRTNLAVTFAVAGAVCVIGALGVAGVARYRGALMIHWHMLPLFLVYPLWGLVQQFLLQALLARNLADGVTRLRSTWRVTPLAASLFALSHWPDTALVGATFLLGLAFTPIYLRWRNLWPLGLYHGWLGAMTYFWLLGRDPWAELFG